MTSVAIGLDGMASRPSWVGLGRLIAALAVVLAVAALWPSATSARSAVPVGRSAEVRAATGSDGAAVDAAVLESPTGFREHVVAPGDTIWDLARSLVGDSDPRDMVDRIARVNGLSSTELHTGSVLLMPTFG